MFWKKGTAFKQLSLVCPGSLVHVHMARRVSWLRYRAWSPSPQSTLCAQFSVVSSRGRSKWPELAHGHCVIVKQCMVNAAPWVGSHRTHLLVQSTCTTLLNAMNKRCSPLSLKAHQTPTTTRTLTSCSCGSGLVTHIPNVILFSASHFRASWYMQHIWSPGLLESAWVMKCSDKKFHHH